MRRDKVEKKIIGNFKVGDVLNGITIKDGHYCSSHYAIFTIADITDTDLVVYAFDHKDWLEKYPKDKCYTKVEMSDEEMIEKYREDIKDFGRKIQRPYEGDRGYHTMDNSCIDYDILSMVSAFHYYGYEFIGYFELDKHERRKCCGRPMEIGMIFSIFDEDGIEERYWFHFYRDYIEDMQKEFKEKFENL